MKNFNLTKQIVLGIGALAVISGCVGLIFSKSLMDQFFPLFIGLTLIGTVLTHKEQHNLQS